LKEFDRRPGDILVVDDDYWMNSFICHWLSGLFPRHGFQSARNGAEALGLSAGGPWALALVDIEMPGMNGLELTRRLVTLQPELPVVTVSLHDTAEHRAAAIRAGARAYVSKTDMFVELPAFLRSLLFAADRAVDAIVHLRLVDDNR